METQDARNYRRLKFVKYKCNRRNNKVQHIDRVPLHDAKKTYKSKYDEKKLFALFYYHVIKKRNMS